MKKIILYTLSLFVCLTIAYICIPRNQYLDELYYIEKNIDDSPEQGIQSLKKFDPVKLSSEELALYCLLLTKGICMHDSVIHSDSIINIAIRYYKNNLDSLRLSQSYLYKGRIFGVKKYLLEASECFQKSKEYAIDGDNETKYLLDYSMGKIYHFKMIYSDEKDVKEDAIHYADLLNDSIKLAHAYMEIAKYYNVVDSSEIGVRAIQKAISVLPQSEKKSLAVAYYELAKNYVQNNQANEGLQYINRTIDIAKDSLALYNYYNLKAEAYYQLNQRDSARYYYKHSLNSDDIRTIMTTYHGLAQLEKEQGNRNEAFRYFECYIQYRDSLDLSREEERIDRLQSIQTYKKQKENIKNAELELNYKKIIIYRIIIVGIISISVLVLLYYKEQRRKRRLEYNMKLEEEKTMRLLIIQKETEYKLLQEQEERKRIEVQQLNQTVDYYKRLNAMTIPILLKSQNNQGAMNLTQVEWDIIIKNTDACFSKFTERLKQYCSILTDEEVQFCCLVKMELSIILLSEIYHIAKGSISRKKMRLKEKLNIENNTFDEFIKNF